ncbi:MAG: RDD family protein [Verrucomicrobia bacterium]|nr:RDD family protein [Verrucomicrobiota bacterium]
MLYHISAEKRHTPMQYHIARNGQQAGIFSEDEVRSKLQLNEFSSSDLCWTEGMAEWQPLGLKFSSTPPPVFTSATPMNPYAPPQTNIIPNNTVNGLQLASLGSRLLAVILDGVIGVALMIPLFIGLFILSSNAESNGEPNFSPVVIGLIGLSVVLFIGLVIYNLILLATRGQTIGKKLMSIRIVTHPEGANPGGVKTILLRAFVNGLIGAVPVLGPIYSLVDICFIFRDDRRCIHDLIAGTQVVQGQPPVS